MKKIYGLLAAAMVLSSTGTQTVSADICLYFENVNLDENGYAADGNGNYIIGANEIIRCVTENRTYLMTYDRAVLEYESEPSEKEMSDIGISSLGCTYILVSTDQPYVLHPLEDGTIQKAENIMPYVSYELDGINHELKDARTGKVITKFNELSESVFSEVIHPAEGQLWSAYVYYNEMKKATMCQYSPIIYHGSTESSIFCSNYEKVDSSEELLTGDLNFDGKVDVTDLSSLSLNIIGDLNLNAIRNNAADITGDGVVNLCDLARMQQYISKKITEF